MQTYDAIVIGVGGVGSAALSCLARRGLSVLGIDRFRPPHGRGSSHGQSRAIRQAYFEHPDYVPLLHRAYTEWRELEQRSGQQLLDECGMLEVGPRDGEVVAGVLRAAAKHSLEVEELSGRQVADRWPALRVPDGLAAVYEPAGGYLRVEACVESLLREAEQHSAELMVDCEVMGWTAAHGSVEVETARGTFRSTLLVITAGAWAGELLRDLGLSLVPLRKSLFWYPSLHVPQAEKLPVYLYELPQGIYYGFLALDGRIKVAEHSGGTPVSDPLRVDPSILEKERAGIEAFLEDCLPAASADLLEHTTCLYTMTTDSHFVVDRHPDHPHVVFAAGLSGHGFKFVPVLGEAVAQLVTNGKTDMPIKFLSIDRFGIRRG